VLDLSVNSGVRFGAEQAVLLRRQPHP
jgi:hypothetical protein